MTTCWVFNPQSYSNTSHLGGDWPSSTEMPHSFWIFVYFCSREFSISAILDIPIYKSRIQSLHLLFSLYSEFKNSQVRPALEVDLSCSEDCCCRHYFGSAVTLSCDNGGCLCLELPSPFRITKGTAKQAGVGLVKEGEVEAMWALDKAR